MIYNRGWSCRIAVAAQGGNLQAQFQTDGSLLRTASVFGSWLRAIVKSRLVRLSCLCGIAAAVFAIDFGPDLCLWQAESSLARRDHVSAAKWLQRSLRLRPGSNARTYLCQIRILRRLGDFQNAESKLQGATKMGVPISDVQREYWLVKAQTNQFGAMQDHWNKLLKDARDDEPEIARAHYSWAMLHHKLDVAKRTLDLWHQDCPNDWEPVYLTGRFYHSFYDLKRAEAAYRSAFALAPGNDEIRLSLATVLQAQLNAKEAIPLFEEYLSRHPQDLSANQGLAESLATTGHLQTAIELLQSALQRNPDDFTLQKTCGELLLAAGDAAAAVEYLETAHRTVPEHANLANELARALKACGRGVEAEPLFAFVKEALPQLQQMSHLEKTLQQQPNNLELRMKIAAITAKYASRKDAILWYENMLRIAPEYLPAHQELVNLYRLGGDLKLADYHAGFNRQNTRRIETSVMDESQPSLPFAGTSSPGR